MTPEIERFLDKATEPFEGKPEAREEARTELMARVSHQGVPLEMIDLSEPLARLEQAPRRNPWKRRGLLLAGFLVLVAGLGLGIGGIVRDIILQTQAQFRGYPLAFTVARGAQDEEAMLDRWMRTNAPELPMSRVSSRSAEDAFRRNPEDVALFQQALLIRREEQREDWAGLTTDERELAERIDPGNGFYAFIEIEPCFDRATRPPGSSVGRFPRHTSAPRKVEDEAEFAKVLRLLGEVAEAPRFHDASGELRRRQIDAFPRPREWMRDELVGVVGGLPKEADGYFPYSYRGPSSTPFGMQAARLGTAGDREGLLALYEQWRCVARHLIGDLPGGGLRHHLVRDWIVNNGSTFEAGFKEMGAVEESARARDLLRRLGASGPAQLRNLMAGAESPSVRVGKWQAVPSDLTMDELAPAGRIEHAAKERGLTWAAVLVALWLTGFTAFEAYRRSRHVRGMARGVMPLLDGRDHAWIGGLGLLLPWAWLWSITRLTPLGLRDLGFDYLDGTPILVSMVQWTAAVVFAATTMLWVTYWRWEKRGGFLGFHGGAILLGRIAAAMAAMAIPAAGVIRYLDLTDDDDRLMYFLGVGGLAVTGLLWLLWIGVLNLCTPKANALRANVVSRTVLAWYLAGALSLLAATEGLRHAERHWYARDPLLPSWTSGTHKNALEERVARDMHDRLRLLFDD